MFENWTSSTCGPCASNNPQLTVWINNNWNNGLICVSYHVGWPSPGNDPMYLHNPTQSYDRRFYYGVNSVPAAYLEGIRSYVGSPFNFANMQVYFDLYRSNTSPISVHVVDARIPSTDSNKATVTVTKLSTLPAGTYYLRVMATEQLITYGSPPGTNGETQFKNVFRRSFPNSTGTSISTASGTETYEFRYRIDPVWNDAQIHTIAFVQNDVDKTMMNSYRNGMTVTGIEPYSNQIPDKFNLEQNYPNPFNPTTNVKFNLPKSEYVTLKIYDMVGNEIKTLVEGNQQAGVYNITVDGSNLSSGVYFYTLRTSSFV
jgi:hypothetical protein